MNNDLLIKLENVTVIKNNKYLLENISLNVRKNEIISIVGKNGAGKSTLCKVLGNIIKPSQGKIYRRNNLQVTYVPQVHKVNFSLPLKVIDFILLNNKTSLENINSLAEKLNIGSLLHNQLKTLSGGELQKVMLCRALLKQPHLLILDEPTSFSDFSSKNNIYKIIQNLQEKEKFSIIVVSHDPYLVIENTSWVLCLNNGRIGCQGNILDIKQNTDFTKIFGDNWKIYNHYD